MQLAERRLFDCLQSILIFLCRILPFKFIIIVIQLMFLGINMFLALLKLILTLAALGLKWVWVGPKTYLCPRTSCSTLLLYCVPHKTTSSRHKRPVFHFNRIVTYRGILFCVEIIGSTLVLRKQRNTIHSGVTADTVPPPQSVSPRDNLH